MSSPFIVIDEITSKINEMNTSLTTKIDNLIGATGNTGGSTTAGTVMAKLNKVITDTTAIINNTKSNNTASTTGTLSQKISSAISNTAATTTENSSGTLSAKLTYLINRRDKTVTPSSTNIKTFSSSGSVAGGGESASTTKTTTSAVFTCYVRYTGVYRGYFTSSTTYSRNSNDGNGSETLSIYGNVSVYHTGSGTTTNHKATISSTIKTGVSSATKTVDFPAQVGDRVQFKIVMEQQYCGWGSTCGGTIYYFNNYTTTWTDISIRGTVNEITATIV